MEDLLILFVERWFIQMIVEKYYYWLHIVSQGLYHAIVTELKVNDPFIQRHQNHIHHQSDVPDFLPIEPYKLDKMLFQNIPFYIDNNIDDYDYHDNKNDDDIF